MCWIEIIEQVEPIEKLISYLKAQDHQKSPNIRRHIAFLYGQIVQVHCKYMISFKIRVNVMFLLTQNRLILHHRNGKTFSIYNLLKIL